MLRVRLILWYSLLVVLTIVTIGVVQNVLIERSLLDALDQSLVIDAETTLRLLQSIPHNVEPETILQHGEMHSSNSMRDLIDHVLSELPDSLHGENLTDRVMSRFVDELLTELSYEDSSTRTVDPMDAIVDKTLSSRRNHYVEAYIVDTTGNERDEESFFRTKNLGRDTLAKIVASRVVNPTDTILALGSVKFHGEILRVVRSASKRFVVFVAFPVTDVEENVRSMQSSFLYLVPLALLVSILGGLWLARKALRPIEQIADTAREIGAKNLSQRIKLPGRTDRELMILTATLNSMFGRLETSFRQIAQFTSDASHELKTPLAIMRGEIEQAQRHLEHAHTLDPMEAHDALESLMEEVERMQRIVEGLLLLSRADDQRLALSLELVNISDFLESISEDAAILAEERGLQLELELDPEAKPVVLSLDPTRFYQVMLNLIDNALKYTPRGGTVTLFLKKTHGGVQLGVSDTGIGVDAEDLPKIFQRFFRTDSARSSEFTEHENARSLGLGLTIVRSIVEAHAGHIDVVSAPGKGTTFTITLPVKE